MRGLTPNEYAIMREALHPASERLMTEFEETTFRRLMAEGRAYLVPDHCQLDVSCAAITPAGREAMRLHEALMAWGAS